MEEHGASLAIFESISKEQAGFDSIDRVYAFRDAARSAVELGDLPKAAKLFEQAWLAADSGGSSLKPIAIGLLGDRAVTAFLIDDRQQALDLLSLAMRDREQLDPESGLRAKYCTHILGHVIVWMRQEIGKTAPFRGFEMKPGLCSNPSPDKYFNDRKIAPEPTLWYQLAELELEADVNVGAQLELRKRLNQLSYPIFETTLAFTTLAVACEKQDLDAFLTVLPRHAQLAMDSMGHDDIFETTTGDPIESSAKPINWESPQFFSLFRMSILPFIASGVFQHKEESLIELKMRLNLAADSNAAQLMNYLLTENPPAAMPDSDFFESVAWCIAMCRTGGTVAGPETATLITTYLTLWLSRTSLGGYLGTSAAEFCVPMWRYVIENCRALLNRPFSTIPSIEEALESQERGIEKLAAISLAIHGATNVTFSADTRSELEAIRDSRKVKVTELQQDACIRS
jgi:hypothetical protein